MHSIEVGAISARWLVVGMRKWGVRNVRLTRCLMKSLGLFLAAAFCLCFPTVSNAQSTGRIECARSDDYIYLYSSMMTLEVRRTLQCGEVVQITGRYEVYFSVRTSKGDVGYVPIASLVVLKDEAGTGPSEGEGTSSDRERTPYDPRPKAPRTAPNRAPAGFALVKDTPIRLRLAKTLSSGAVHSGDAVEFEVTEDVLVNGLVVIARGTKVTGTVVEAEPKKRFGHDGKVSFKIESVRLVDNETASVRCYHEFLGDVNAPPSSSSSGLSLASGKDAVVPEGTEFTVLTDGEVALKREAFAVKKDQPESVPAAAAQGPQR
jgi:hypothetical protein